MNINRQNLTKSRVALVLAATVGALAVGLGPVVAHPATNPHTLRVADSQWGD